MNRVHAATLSFHAESDPREKALVHLDRIRVCIVKAHSGPRPSLG